MTRALWAAVSSLAASAFVLVALALVPSSAAAQTFGVDMQLGGGSVLAWDSSDETGNAFGGTLLLDVDAFAVGIGLATVLPDSRLQANFGAFWLEGRWYFLDAESLLSPYAVVGFGLATADDFVRGSTGFVPARWSSDLGPVGMVGAGVRFGEATGMYLAADVRAWNHTHLGIQLVAGYRFF